MITVRILDFAREASILRELRMRVLYPNLPETKSVYPGDEGAVHVGAFDGTGILIGIASLFSRDDGTLQLRGMATSAEARGSGTGLAVVRFAEAYAREKRIARLWCNARLAAMGFYAKCGWKSEGEEFEVPDIGPHYVMASGAV